MMKHSILVSLSMVLGAGTVAFSASTAAAAVLSNTQVRLPNNTYVDDIDDGGKFEFITASSDKLFVTNGSYALGGKIYKKLPSPVKRLITGKFAKDSTKWHQVCAILQSNELRCYGISTDKKDLWYWFSQNNFIADDEHAVVGDFNGDGYHDVLVYKPSTGAVRMYSRVNTYFEAMPGWVAGNLSSIGANMQIRAGQFGGTGSFTDLLVENPANGQIRRFDSVKDSSGNYTFWWAFTTNGGIVGSKEEVTIANVDDGTKDEVVLHDTATGAYRFFSMTYNGGNLTAVPASTVSQGQLDKRAGAKLFWWTYGLDNEPGTLRDDALLYDTSASKFVNTSARWDATASIYTYWWAYTQQALNLSLDQDGDGIKTIHELGGYDPNDDGVSEAPLHQYGASPFAKDIFVEVDYMASPDGTAADFRPTNAALNLAISEMAAMKLNLHVMVDQEVPYDPYFGSYTNATTFRVLDWVTDFDTPYKNAHFSKDRAPFFHYCIFGNHIVATKDDGTVDPNIAGMARGVPGSDFIVGLGGWGGPNDRGTDAEQTGTFLHELGHNLNLLHGGPDDVGNKPNYLSIMNYIYLFSGVARDGQRRFLYSDVVTNPLDENNLNEAAGVTFPGTPTANFGIDYGIIAYPGTTNIDWNWNGKSTDIGVHYDLNVDKVNTVLAGGTNDYARMMFSGGGVGSAAGRAPDPRAATGDAELIPVDLALVGDEGIDPTDPQQRRTETEWHLALEHAADPRPKIDFTRHAPLSELLASHVKNAPLLHEIGRETAHRLPARPPHIDWARHDHSVPSYHAVELDPRQP